MRETISKNLIYYRKKSGLTQAQLAEKLGYTDKAISKWERGESVPDVFVLKEIANIFGIKVSILLDEEQVKSPISRLISTKRKSVLFIYAFMLVLAIATMLYVVFSMIFPDEYRFYIMFIYAIPIGSMVICILNKRWKVPLVSLIFLSLLNWSVALSIYLTFHNFLFILKDYYVFFAAIPIQILLILWFLRNKNEKTGN